MLELTLIRHGKSIWNQTGRMQGGRVQTQGDVPLSDEGMKQSGALAKRLATYSFDKIYSSDLLRAKQTAEIVCPDRELIFDARLREIDVGHFEGKLWSELSIEEWDAVAVWFSGPYDKKILGGESSDDLQQRILSWMSELPDEGNVAVFTHGGWIEAALYAVTGRPEATLEQWREKSSWGFSLNNTSLTRLEITKQAKTIRTVNDCAHLEYL